jgi:hypothetical protein
MRDGSLDHIRVEPKRQGNAERDPIRRRGIELAFAELKGPVKDRLRLYGVMEQIGEENLYPTIGLAVRAHVARHGVEWRDWEDRRAER